MAPVIAYSPAAGGSKDGKKAVPRLLGSAISGVSELFLFHPVDTTAKRLMSNKSQVYISGNFNQSMVNANNVIFRDAANLGVVGKWKSLFPGLGFAAGYKILQRTYKFGGQPYVKEYMNNHHGDKFASVFGQKHGKTLSSACAGSLMGIGEVALLPLDVLKIKAQTNPDVLKGRGVAEIFKSEGFGLYRGWGWTMARNAPGSFALFGGATFTHSLFTTSEKEASFFQNFCASIGGAVASIVVAAPLDVIKTRVQMVEFGDKTSGVTVLTDLVKTEGFGGFFKGLTPKLIVVGPKLVFSFTVAQTMIAYFEKTL